MEQFDKHTGYCRMLGHDVPFSYCRQVQESRPCFKILDCWFDKLPVQEYMDRHYSKDEQEDILKKPTPKILTLVDLIEKAKNRNAL
ncbi:conserved hypothetical protein [Desulfamplus magnetovallimortis]|uniref:Uncharacterized protein n=1 Tax=Desulfamplus magnetovallimortis TaxID=1246637 RepID=A0A1W1HGS4_9BACT|nr:hypothetical protein [Desulfamplus magnetovallimortis]SLM31605.1 conserved hypothetical protein [Desulfamplus magnetovallimortis]